MIYVCPLAGLAETARSLPRYRLLSLMSPSHPDESWRRFAQDSSLHLSFNDITEARTGFVAPDREAISKLIEFGSAGTGEVPLLIHCWAGISRSSAAAYIVACTRNEGIEDRIAVELRTRAPFATPNVLMISLADEALRRGGRMVAAVSAIGRGTEAGVGTLYELPLVWPPCAPSRALSSAPS